MHHDWPVKKAIVDLPVRLKGNLKCISVVESVGGSVQGFRRCLTDVTNWVKLHLQGRLYHTVILIIIELSDHHCKQSTGFFWQNFWGNWANYNLL